MCSPMGDEGVMGKMNEQSLSAYAMCAAAWLPSRLCISNFGTKHEKKMEEKTTIFKNARAAMMSRV